MARAIGGKANPAGDKVVGAGDSVEPWERGRNSFSCPELWSLRLNRPFCSVTSGISLSPR